jgi:superfamily II RNA helicase
MVAYERLPAAMRAQMTKRQYQQTEYNDSSNASAAAGGSGNSTGDGPAAAAPGCLLPVVIFCFSKKKCEEIIDFFRGKDLITAGEKAVVRAVRNEALGRLSPQDARLPQVCVCVCGWVWVCGVGVWGCGGGCRVEE